MPLRRRADAVNRTLSRKLCHFICRPGKKGGLELIGTVSSYAFLIPRGSLGLSSRWRRYLSIGVSLVLQGRHSRSGTLDEAAIPVL
ncbi:hypothetical protein KC360_g135 [Hortaea werneckii]|nr:hypothetical protein KC360_g135 [Hortaea werneckii]